MFIAIGFRLYAFDEAGLTVNPTLLESVFIVWTQAELNFSIVAATVPVLRRFVSGLATYYGALDQNKATDGTGHELRSDSEFPVSPLTSGIKSANRDGCRPPLLTENPPSTKRFSFARAEQNRGYGVLAEPVQNWPIASNMDQQNLSKPTNFTGNEGITSTYVVARDSNSLVSNDSQQMIIKKDVTWTVERGPNRRDS